MEASVDPQPRGPDWMPITPKTGSLFHAETHLQFVTDGIRIEADLIQTTFPSTRPVRRMLVLGDGRRIPRNEALEIEIGPEDEPYPEEDEIDLEEISKRISPLLKRGTLEMVVVGHYETKTAYFERLIIGSDGSVERRSQTAERDKPSGWLKEMTETYVPTTAAVAPAAQQLSFFN